MSDPIMTSLDLYLDDINLFNFIDRECKYYHTQAINKLAPILGELTTRDLTDDDIFEYKLEYPEILAFENQNQQLVNYIKENMETYVY